MARPLALDLFCGAGGAALGLHRAGFSVIGVDIKPQPNYPFDVVQANALRPPFDLDAFDFIWASPPCQAHSRIQMLAAARNGGYPEHADLIAETRRMLKASGRPYIIENVAGAPLLHPIKLFGSQFGLRTQRERWFESNLPLVPPARPPRRMQTPPAGQGLGPNGEISICGSGGVRGLTSTEIIEHWQDALGIYHTDVRAELAEAIPPAYSEFLGRQVMHYISAAPLSLAHDVQLRLSI